MLTIVNAFDNCNYGQIKKAASFKNGTELTTI